ncbi:hypothetical protein AVEN_226291-1 [Araneus ventricosus]|uniref:Uncharacterized protein n=1 Tax=Araneus ventricosus TaxID=182803 RepID=A0A4Y2DAN8_ARAVE|nr:hypothetical protein AVEN_226291-1 [Araneus ventricosus]
MALHTIPFSAHPFREVMHRSLHSNHTINTSPTGTPIHYCIYFHPPAPISSRAREPQPPPPCTTSTTVAFQHLWPGNPNGVFGYSERLKIQTLDHTAPILIGFSH